MRSSKVPVLLALGVASSLLTLTACGGGDDTSSAGESASAASSASSDPSGAASPSAAPSKIAAMDNLDAVKVTGAFGKEPKVTVKSPWAIDKTRTKVLEPSDGAVVKAGQTVEVNYYGVNGRTGKKFDDSFKTGKPVALPLDQVVPGFKKGLVGQKQGSRVVIAMPGKDGYDASGGSEQAGIKVGDSLVFVVDLVGGSLEGPEGTAVSPKAGLPKVSGGDTPKVTVPKTDAPTRLVIQPLIKGKGAKVKASDTITFNYTWVKWSNGKVLEESYTTKPASYALSGLLPGMQKGLLNQRVGSRMLLVIPPADGYPSGNATPKIGKDETLVMVIDILFAQAGQ